MIINSGRSKTSEKKHSSRSKPSVKGKTGGQHPNNTGGLDQSQTELMKQFGREKGQEYYGAIRELEEFLEPNKDFQFENRTQEGKDTEGNSMI